MGPACINPYSFSLINVPVFKPISISFIALHTYLSLVAQAVLTDISIVKKGLGRSL